MSIKAFLLIIVHFYALISRTPFYGFSPVKTVFFQEGLREGGCIVLKENVSSSADKYDFDSEDNSWTRPKERIVQLLRMAGLSLLSDRKQTHFPRGMLAVYMFAVK